MAHHKSAKKRIRRNERARGVNKNRMSRIRTFIRKVREAKDQKAGTEALKAAQPEIHRGVSKGVLHQKTASRWLSRLSAHVKGLSKKAA